VLGHLVYTGHNEDENYTVMPAGWLTRWLRAIFTFNWF
jgi:hypothetical protein